MTILNDVSKLAKRHGVTIVVIQPDAPVAAAAPQAKRSAPTHAINHSNTGRTRAPNSSKRGGPYAMPKDPGPNATPAQRTAYNFAVWLTRQMNRYGVSDAQLEAKLGFPADSSHVIRSGRSCGSDRKARLRDFFSRMQGDGPPAAVTQVRRKPKLAQRQRPFGGYMVPNRTTSRASDESYRWGVWLTEQMNAHGLQDEVVANSLDIPVGSVAQMRRGYYLPAGERQRHIREWFASLKPGAQPEPQSLEAYPKRKNPWTVPAKPRRGGRRGPNGPPYAMPKRHGTGAKAEDAYQFGRWLTQNLNDAKLTVGELAELAGISRQAIYAMRAGFWQPSKVTRAKMEQLFNNRAQPAAAAPTEEVTASAAQVSV